MEAHQGFFPQKRTPSTKESPCPKESRSFEDNATRSQFIQLGFFVFSAGVDLPDGFVGLELGWLAFCGSFAIFPILRSYLDGLGQIATGPVNLLTGTYNHCKPVTTRVTSHLANS